MKNQNQAEVKTANKTQSGRDQKIATASLAKSVRPVGGGLPPHPLSQQDSCEVKLDWIGDTMEPEVRQGSFALIVRRSDMLPLLGELVVGLLKNGRIVFGALEIMRPGVYRIAFINPKYKPVHYQKTKFKWLVPVDLIISRRDVYPHYTRTEKRLFYYADHQ